MGLLEMLPGVEVKRSPLGTSVHAHGQSCSPGKCSAMWTPKVVTCNASQKQVAKAAKFICVLISKHYWGFQCPLLNPGRRISYSFAKTGRALLCDRVTGDSLFQMALF